MPAYTLYYFNGRGRAEICRIVFAAAAVQFMDKRIKVSEWNNFKSKMPGSMLPVLEIDGKTQIPQSMAIARYLAREYGFYGKTNIEMARIDYICDCFYEVLDDFLRMYNEKDPTRKADWRQQYNDTCRRIFPFMEKTLSMYFNGDKFYMGDQVFINPDLIKTLGRVEISSSSKSALLCSPNGPPKSICHGHSESKQDENTMKLCDMMCYAALENPLIDNPNMLKDYPKIRALRIRVAGHPRIGDYFKKRTTTDF